MDNVLNIEVLEQFSDLLWNVKTKENLQYLLDQAAHLKEQYPQEVLKPIYEALEIFKGLW